MSSFVVIDKLPELIEQFHTEVAKAIAETADEITLVYASTAALDTGFMRSSAYTVTHDGSTYGQHLQGATDRELLPEVPKPENDLTAYSAVGASYAAYLEFGTRNMSAQPAFYPAVDKVKPRYEARLLGIASRLKGIGE